MKYTLQELQNKQLEIQKEQQELQLQVTKLKNKIKQNKQYLENLKRDIKKLQQKPNDKSKVNRIKGQILKANKIQELELRNDLPTNVEKRLGGFSKSMIDNPTDAEKAFKQLLIDNDIEFEDQKPIMFKKMSYEFILDFYIPSEHMAIEIDGEYHNSNKQRCRDKLKDLLLSKANIKTVRFTNEEVLNNDKSIQEFINNISH